MHTLVNFKFFRPGKVDSFSHFLNLNVGGRSLLVFMISYFTQITMYTKVYSIISQKRGCVMVFKAMQLRRQVSGGLDADESTLLGL